MKKNMFKLVFCFVVLVSFSLKAQNRVFLDLEGGVSRPMDPMSKGYNTKLASPYHIKAGIRVMAIPSFGVKLSYTEDYFKNISSAPSFKSKVHLLTIEGILNIGRACRFEDFSKHIGLFVHVGPGVGYLIGKDLKDVKGRDRVGNFQFGFTSIFKASERIGFTADISMYGNCRQNRTFDFKTAVDKRGFEGYYANISLGVSFAFGKHQKSMDWTFADHNGSSESMDSLGMELEILKQENTQLEDSVSIISEKMKDADEDGVPNYLDKEPKTKAGVEVDIKGREIIYPNFENLLPNPVVGPDLFYTVQLGVYSRVIPEKYWRNIEPIYMLKMEDGTRRYFHNVFHSVADATPALNVAKLSGIEDAFITAYYKGKRITIAEADKILEANGPSVLRKKP